MCDIPAKKHRKLKNELNNNNFSTHLEQWEHMNIPQIQ